MIYYTIYKVTNKINGKIYIGSHKTKDLKDSYMGSGKYLLHAQFKHGIENFVKEILYVFDTPELMYAKEAELVTADFIAETNTYNLKIGGFGGWDYINKNNLGGKYAGKAELDLMKLQIAREKLKTLNTDDEWREDQNAKLSAGLLLYYETGAKGHFTGKTHTIETKNKMSVASKGKSVGSKNSQHGSMWITNGQESKKIKKDLDTIPVGWYKGRKQK